MAARDHSDLTVAVVHFQTPKLLEQCLESLRGAAPSARVIVVDTSEQEPLDESWSSVHPGIELRREANHSYAAAVNSALRLCSTTRFAQLNADVVVRPETFDDLARALDESGAAMAGPVAFDGDGRMQRNGLPYRLHQWRLSRSDGWTFVPWLSGCLQYLRFDVVWRVGGMDTSLRFYNEDLEWCLRLRTVGERCVLVATPITHWGGSSTPASALPVLEGLRGGFVVTRRYRGRTAREAHRLAVAAGAGLLGLVARAPWQRDAYLRAARMVWRQEVDESPYGPTLGSPNPFFQGGGVTA